MPRHQDPGYYGQHAFTAFIHAEDSPFVRFSLTPHFNPAQCLKKNEAGGGGGGAPDLPQELVCSRRFVGKAGRVRHFIVRSMYHPSDKLRPIGIFVRFMIHSSDKGALMRGPGLDLRIAILDRITAQPSVVIWTPVDSLDLGSREAVDQALL